MAVILRSPRQASTIFDLGGPWAPRSRNLFFISFSKALSANTASSGPTPTGSVTSGPIQEWQRSLPFLAKAVDRPQVQPQAEELNQYNKRRQIYTGYKVSPMKVTFYDTADNLAHRMWDEYAKSFFGDFGHDNHRNDFNYDVTTNQFFDNAGTGFGFAPKAARSAGDNNAQFFFNSISVYQVFRDTFIQFDIVNPKIVSFDPDDLSYEDASIGTISISLVYEAIIYKNNGVPQPLANDPMLYQAFSDAKLKGGVPDFTSEQPVIPAATSSEVSLMAEPQSQMNYRAPTINDFPATETGSGSLLAYGDFNFGSTHPDNASPSLAADLTTRAAADPTLASILNIIPPPIPADKDSIASGVVPAVSTGLDPAMVDVARAAVSAAGSAGGTIDMSYIGETIVATTLASGVVNKDSPRSQVLNRHPSTVSGPNHWSSAGKNNGGIALTRQAYGIMNAQRSPCSQIGFNTRRRPR